MRVIEVVFFLLIKSLSAFLVARFEGTSLAKQTKIRFFSRNKYQMLDRKGTLPSV